MDRASDSGSEGWGFESLPVYQKMRIPTWVSAFFNTLGGTRKGGRAKRGKKVSGGHFFSPWESPLICRRIRYGCGCESNILRKTIFLVCTRKRIPIWVSSFLFRPPGGKGLERSNAGSRRHLPGICFFAFPMVENCRKYATIFLKKLHPRNRRECDEKEIYTG